jgi:hypothetical protein
LLHPFLCSPGDQGDERVAPATLVSLTFKERQALWFAEESFEQMAEK